MHRAAIILLFVLSTGCYDSNNVPSGKRQEVATNTTLTELRKLYTGSSFEITGDISVAGYVTTSDREDNFYRTLCIEDNGAAIEIMAGIDHLFNSYPIGSSLVVHLKGLTIGESYGTLQIGRKPAPGSGYPTDYIGSVAALDKIIIRTGQHIGIQPTIVELQEFTPSFCGRLVRIEGLRYTPNELDATAWAGYRRFTDDNSAVLHVYTRNFARWATNDVPTQRVTLTGILQYGKADGGDEGYILKLRNENDCTY